MSRPQIAVVTTASVVAEVTVTQMQALSQIKRTLTNRAGIFGVLGAPKKLWAPKVKRAHGWHLAVGGDDPLGAAKARALELGPDVFVVVPPGEVASRMLLLAAITAALRGHEGQFDPDVHDYAAVPVSKAAPEQAPTPLPPRAPLVTLDTKLDTGAGMFHLGIRAPMWKREDLTRAFLAHYDRMVEPLQAHGIELVLVAVGTGEDYIARVGAGTEHWHFIDHPNDPATLGRKMAAGLQWLQGRVDAALNLGSDDFVSALTLRKLASLIYGGADFLGWASGCFFAHPAYGVKRWPGYPSSHRRHGEPVGAGRCYSARMLDALSWDLWVGGRLHKMDGYAWHRVAQLAHAGFRVQPMPGAVLGPMVDVKSRDSAQPWDRLGSHNKGVPYAEARAVLAAVGLSDMEIPR